MKKYTLQVLTLSAAVINAAACYGEVYKWVDEDGTVHYSDIKPQEESIEVKVFLGSPIQIDDSGKVVQAQQTQTQTQTQANKKSPETAMTFSGLLVQAKEYLEGWWAAESQDIASPKTMLQNTTSPEISSQIKESPSNSVVISNDNMGVVLQQIERDKQEEQDKAEALAHPSVEIFTAPWCGYCKQAIVYLKLKNIAYQEYDVTANPSAALRQKMLGGSGGVPFAVINGKTLSGWSKQSYARALGLE